MTTVRPHDFHRTETLDRQYVPALHAIFDTFARRSCVELSSSLRRPAQVAASSPREMSWRDLTTLLGELPYLRGSSSNL